MGEISRRNVVELRRIELLTSAVRLKGLGCPLADFRDNLLQGG